MMRYVKNWQIDLFAVPITLNHEGKEKKRSLHGMFLTILFAGFIIWFIYSLSGPMLKHQNPNTITYDSFQEIPPPIELNKETFPFAIGMQLPSSYGLTYFMDEEIYVPVVKLLVFTNVEQSDGTISKQRQIIDVDIEPCTLEHFGSAKASVTQLPLSSMYCVNPVQSNLDKIEVAGQEDFSTYKAFYIGIQRCNIISTRTCKSDDEITAKLTRSYINIIYMQSAINPQNYDEPNQRFATQFSSLLSPTMLKSGILQLNHLDVIDDDGWLFATKKTKSYVKVATPIERFDLEPDPSGYLYSGVFELGQVLTKYERQYTRLQTVLAQIQGSAATIILALVIILRPYSQVKFKEVLINELFDVKMKKQDYAKNKNNKNSGNKPPKKLQKKPKSLKSLGGQEKEPAKSPKNTVHTTQGVEIKLSKIASQEFRDGNHRLLSLASDRPQSLATDRPLKSPRDTRPEEKEEEKAFTTKVQSFKTILNSIENENENESPGIKISQTLEKRALLESVKGQQEMSSPDSMRKSTTKGQNLVIEKPDKIKLTALSDVVSDGPDSPRNVSDISLKEEKQQEEENEKSVPIEENDKKGYLQLSIPPMSPQNGAEMQGLVSLEMAEMKQDGEQEEAVEDEEEEEEAENEDEDALKYESSKIDISIWEFFASYIRRNNRTKEKFNVLNKGMKNVKERMDILNIMKKFRELDKLKALLLEEDQLTLFNAMPKAEITSGETEAETNSELMKSKSFSQRILKKSTFIEMNEKQEEINKAYEALQMKAKKSKIDSRLMELYENMLTKKNS